jgi:uncharacterized phage protein (predicted DNA packaging)
MLTLERVKEHLRIEHDLEDALITSYMGAAIDFAETFLGRKLDEFGELPAMIQAGILIHVALLYEAREGEFMEKNLPAIRLLYWPYRAVTL